jgi:hypothetical protein
MTVVDPTGQMEIHHPPEGDRVFVTLPLADWSKTWIREFRALARTNDVPVDVGERPDGASLLVTVPVAASREETAELLDRALGLIDEAQALADTRDSASVATEQYIRDWWENRTQSPNGNTAPD